MYCVYMTYFPSCSYLSVLLKPIGIGDPAKLRELTTVPGQEGNGAEDWRPPKGRRSRRRDSQAGDDAASGGGGVMARSLRRQLGFTLRVGPSTVPTAGDGVFLEGKARIGALVGLFPGLVYLPEHLKTQEDVQALFPDPDFFLFQRSVFVCLLVGWSIELDGFRV